MSYAYAFTLVLLLSVIGIGFYVMYSEIPIGDVKRGDFTLERDFNLTGEAQFYPNMRYPDSTITYSLRDTCTIQKERDVRRAFDILAEESVLEFNEVEEDGEINIFCSRVAPELERERHFVAGEGGPAEIVRAGEYNVILSGMVSLFRSDECENPQIALHEILHALGFDHNDNSDSIMYPVTSCGQVVDDYIFEEINKVYEVQGRPDLAIEKVEVNRVGRYIDFEIEIVNQGLKTADASTLIVSVEDREAKEFELDETKVGIKRVLRVDNLRMPLRNFDEVIFEIVLEQDELSKDNNIVSVSVN